MEAYLGTVLMRTLHILFGILWIGLLYYFNFVQTEYFKESEADAKSDVVKKLVPNAFGTSFFTTSDLASASDSLKYSVWTKLK